MKNINPSKRKSARKWAMTGQHNGIGTYKQRHQSRMDKLAHKLSNKRFFAMARQSMIDYKPHSILNGAGTRKSVLDLKHPNGKPQYGRLNSGAIVALKP